VRIWQNRSPYRMLVGIQISTTTMECNMKTLKNLKIELSYDPVMLILGIYSKECKS
jgi:hypothetical protein